jgi:hypothetical protein
MTYTYGYIKKAILNKMNLTEREAKEQDLLGRFNHNINECLVQIASTIKPKLATHTVEVYPCEIPIPEKFVYDPLVDDLDAKQLKEEQLKEYLKDKAVVGDRITMPKDFLAFSGKPYYFGFLRYCKEEEKAYWLKAIKETNIEQLVHIEDKTVVAKIAGKFFITYDAIWPTFVDQMTDEIELDIPFDILNCIPSYVASQLWKIDDERKSNMFRNEFEVLFTRINNSDPREVRHISTEGGW